MPSYIVMSTPSLGILSDPRVMTGSAAYASEGGAIGTDSCAGGRVVVLVVVVVVVLVVVLVVVVVVGAIVVVLVVVLVVGAVVVGAPVVDVTAASAVGSSCEQALSANTPTRQSTATDRADRWCVASGVGLTI
jgi:hypothetical protein